MASPFKIFRKNQKLAMAALLILIMFAFLFLPLVADMMGLRGGAQQDLVVAKTSKFGNLKQSNIAFLRSDRQQAAGAMIGILEAAKIPAGQLARAGRGSIAYSLIRYVGMAPQAAEIVDSLLGPRTDEELVETWLLSHYAEQQGIVIGNDVINAFLTAATGDRVDSSTMHAVFRNAGMSAEQFFRLLRQQLMAEKVREFFLPVVNPNAATPGERWDYFNRINRSATIEAVAVPVARYVDKVPKPTEDQLKQFFEENKERIAVPTSWAPGFRQPQRVELAYVKADFDKFLKAVTDKQILDQYEQDKEKYDEIAKKMAAEKAAIEAATKRSSELKLPDLPSSVKETKGQPAKPSPAAPKAGGQPAKAAPAAPKTPAKAKEPAKESKKTSSTGSSSGERNVTSGSAFHLAAATEEKKAGDKGEQKPAAQKAPAAKKEAGKPAETKPEAPKTGLTDELKTFIRRELAEEKINASFAEVKEEISKFSELYNDYSVRAIHAEQERKKIGPPPSEPDLATFAKERGLTTDRTALQPVWELRDSDVGQSQEFEFVTAASGERQRRYGPMVSEYAFQSPGLFHPQTSVGLKGNLYLFWKTKEQKEHEPKFEDVRKDVVDQWKVSKARPLALKAAQSLATDARKAEKPLKQFFAERPEYHVILPAKFTWLRFADVAFSWQQQAELSSVEGVDMAGWEFMREVFGLQPDQVGVAFNAPKTVVYLVRPAEFTPSYDLRWSQFKTEPYERYANAGLFDRRELYQAWLGEIKRSVGFAWGPGHKLAEHQGDYAPAAPVDDED